MLQSTDLAPLLLCVVQLYGVVMTYECEYYSRHNCHTGTGECSGRRVCPAAEPGKRTHCYVFWNNTGGIVDVILKGCWLDTPECYNQSSCVAARQQMPDTFFCCCERSLCNVNFSVSPAALLWSPSATYLPAASSGQEMNMVTRTLLCSLLPLILIAAFVVCLFWLYRQRRQRFAASHQQHHYQQQQQQGLYNKTSSSSLLGQPIASQLDIRLVKVIARGRFGSVWKAEIPGEGATVAVKVFPEHDRHSWILEQRFYTLPHTRDCANILRFIGAESHGSELWLITEYHDVGSLYDHLKAHTITLNQLADIALSLANGLAFLHADVNGKPSVAHRDVKSRNVLLHPDMTACIADFGLALILDANQASDTFPQVGTRRYMAPELLDGSINFAAEYFLKIDIYACALVLWEILSRCADLPGECSVKEYQAPFETEVGLCPSLEDMQQLVVLRQQRPQISDEWLQDAEMMMMMMTVS